VKKDCGENLKTAADEAMLSLIGIIRNGQQKQVFIEGNPMTLALSTMSMIQGVSVMMSSGKLKVKVSSLPNANRQTLLRGMVLQLFDVFLQGLKR